MHPSDSLYIGVIFAGFALSITGFAILSPLAGDTVEQTPSTLSAPSYQYTVTGERYTADPSEFTQLCVGQNCVPGLEEEQVHYESVGSADAWMEPSDMVVSVSTEDTTVAYPVTVLQHHFVINTAVDGTPIVVTYAPHAGHATAFSRNLDTEDVSGDLSFSFTGALLYGDIVMQDAATGTRWSPYHGEGIVGELAGTRLHRIDTDVRRWSLWKRTHPNGSVLSRDTDVYNASRYADDPYFTYRQSGTLPVQRDVSDRLDPKDMVYGVKNGESTAYREVHIKDFELVQDTVGGTPIMIVQDEATGRITGFERRVNGERLSFKYDEENGQLQTSDGTVWTMTGQAVSGPLQGELLDRVPITRMYWFSWYLFNPSTDVYRP